MRQKKVLYGIAITQIVNLGLLDSPQVLITLVEKYKVHFAYTVISTHYSLSLGRKRILQSYSNTVLENGT